MNLLSVFDSSAAGNDLAAFMYLLLPFIHLLTG